jgi:hypothetical protein
VSPSITKTYTIGVSKGPCVKDTTIKVVVIPVKVRTSMDTFVTNKCLWKQLSVQNRNVILKES